MIFYDSFICSILTLQRKNDGKMTFSSLPVECKHEILTKLPDHMDLVRLGQTDSATREIVQHAVLWKELVLFHFSRRQILTFINTNTDENQIDWKYVYKRCYL